MANIRRIHPTFRPTARHRVAHPPPPTAPYRKGFPNIARLALASQDRRIERVDKSP